MNLNFFKKSSFWGLVVAILALIFSQLPPIKVWFPKKDIKVRLAERISIDNDLGITSFIFLIDLQNNGNRAVNITSVELHLTYPTSDTKIIKAETYGEVNDIITVFPFTSVEIEEGKSWKKMVAFMPKASPDLEEQLNNIRLKISQDLRDKIQTATWDKVHPGALIPASEGNIKLAMEEFNKNFFLPKGEYNASIIMKDSQYEILKINLSFTLYDFHIQTIKSQCEDYKYGIGIIMPSEGARTVWTTIRNYTVE